MEIETIGLGTHSSCLILIEMQSGFVCTYNSRSFETDTSWKDVGFEFRRFAASAAFCVKIPLLSDPAELWSDPNAAI